MKKEDIKKKIWKILPLALWIALLAVEILLGIQICLLDMLPTKYLLIVLAALGLVAILIGKLLFLRQGKRQKNPGHTHHVIGFVLSAVVIAGCLAASSVLSQVQETIDAVTENPEVTAVVDVYVLKEDAAQTIEDAKTYTFAVTESFDWENTQITLAGIRELTGCEVKTARYPTVFAMVDALYAKEVDALIVNSAYIDLLSGLESYGDFTDRVKLVCAYNVEKPAPTETEPTKAPENTENPGTTAGTEPTSPQNTGPQPFILYVSGVDTRSSRLYNSCSDVNILVAVNPQTKQVLLVNTPRDYYIPNPAGNGALDKLTHCGLYGVDCSVAALEGFYDIDISYYAQINFTGFEALINAVGGVTVHSDVGFYTETRQGEGFHIRAGDNNLNGSQALAFARERHNVAGGDNDRGKNQMKVIKALIDKLSSGAIITNYGQILDSLKGMFATNMPQPKIAELVKMQLSDMARWNVQSYAVTGDNSSGRNYSLPNMTVYIMLPHEDKVEYARNLIDRVLRGEILTEADMTGN